MPASSFQGNESLSFRGVDDTLAEHHVEGSECCLIHADNPLSKELGVFLNPNVRVAYNAKAYRIVHPHYRPWVGFGDIWVGLWKNRITRWLTTPMLKEWVCRRRHHLWERAEIQRTGKEKGQVCLINEMQVLIENGWAHV
jgi:hypothetical protein